jgi:hypothetical protein
MLFNVQVTAPGAISVNRFIDRMVGIFLRYGLIILLTGLLFFTLMPFAAPVAMALGWSSVGNALYWFYSFSCHQLPQRSWFLFGPQLTYTLAEIQQVYPAESALTLHAFTGTPEMGWKVAWSDRMLSWYTMTAVWGVLYWSLTRLGLRIRPLPWHLFVWTLLPLVLDGATHLVNDAFYGMSGTGFRDTNSWLAALTGNGWPAFYAGDHLGTFNWWARLLTGIFAAWGVAFATFPRLDALLAGETKRYKEFVSQKRGL